MGSPECAVEVLKALPKICGDCQHQLAAIISQPSQIGGRGNKLIDPPVVSYCKELNLPVLQPEKIGDPVFLDTLRQLHPDLIITAAYGQILTKDFLKIPKRGTINIHPSILPRYRGATPVQAALLDGASTTGVTILFTVRKLDAGNIIIQKDYPLEGNETADQLLNRLFRLGCELLPQAFSLLENPAFAGTPQEESQVSHCRKIEKEDGLISWSSKAEEIYNHFKAFYPWPGSFTHYLDKRISIEHMSLGNPHSPLSPGEFCFKKQEKLIEVGTGSGSIYILALKPAGGKLLDPPAFWNGLKNKDRLIFSNET